MKTLQSFLSEEWVTGTGGGRVLSDACTGAAVATIHGGGFDAKEILRCARETGGPALRKMTFHERALILKELAKYLSERKKALYEISTQAGCTSADSWIDIDGGIGVLFTYASKGRRELPNAHHLVEGPVEFFAKDGSFGGLHLGVPKEGAAVHINAFNFPVWGMLEKFAPAFRRGRTRHHQARHADCVSRRSGRAGDRRFQASFPQRLTAAHLRERRRSVRPPRRPRLGRIYRVRGDRGQAARASQRRGALGQVHGGSRLPELRGPGAVERARHAGVRSVRGGRSSKKCAPKAGQKCTAIRRAFVPEAHVEAAVAKIKERLGTIAVGNPRHETVRMGPLASRDQVLEVEKAVAALSREATIEVGADMPPLVDADAGVGAFVAPTLLVATGRSLDAVHSVEAFGPVCTIVPYKTVDDAVDMVKAGAGSLVASVFARSSGRRARDRARYCGPPRPGAGGR